jgi:ABC-2 type transport system permease protein
LGGYAIIAFASSIVLQLLTALGLWMSAVAVLPDPSEFPLNTVIIGNLIYLPALWVIIGLALFLIGVFPKAVSLIWAVYGAVFLLGLFGRMDVFPSWLLNITPFGFVPQYPMESINWQSMAVLTAIAAALAIIGLIGFRRRDIEA